MLNICFFMGKVINKVDLNFVYNKRKKRLSKRHICIVNLELELEGKEHIALKAYNEIADFVYKNVKEGDNIFVQGILEGEFIEIDDIYII